MPGATAEHEKGGLPVGLAERDVQADIARPLRHELCAGARQRLDRDATPATLVQRPGVRRADRIIRPDIDEKPPRLGKGPGQHHIFKISGVADEWTAAPQIGRNIHTISISGNGKIMRPPLARKALSR